MKIVHELHGRAQVHAHLMAPSTNQADHPAQTRNGAGSNPAGATITACFSARSLLAWWFVLTVYQGGSTVVGPFVDEVGCNAVRQEIQQWPQTLNLSRCWSSRTPVR